MTVLSLGPPPISEPLARTQVDMHKLRAKSTTINDVAQHAGVSYQTVSRVINDHPSVAQETRSRVHRAIRQLDYHPSAVARSLAQKQSTTLGVVSYGIFHAGPAQMLARLESAASERGYDLAHVNVGTLSHTQLEQAIQKLRRQRVQGIIVFAPLLEAGAEPLETLCPDLPMVITDAEPRVGRFVSAVDQFTGGRLAAQHLIGLGHTEFALVSGPLSWYAALIRQQGWLSVLEQHKLTPQATLQADWTARGGYQAVCELLERHTPFSALLMGNDQMALGALWALEQRGLSVPGAVSVVGFDDLPESPYYSPPLTTVRQDFAQLAQQSLDQLVACIETPERAQQLTMLLPSLVVRSSTAPVGRGTRP